MVMLVESILRMAGIDEYIAHGRTCALEEYLVVGLLLVRILSEDLSAMPLVECEAS